MSRVTRSSFVALVLLAVSVAPSIVSASTRGSELFLPAVGSGAGVPPSFWYTTVWVFNPNEDPVEVEFAFLRRGQSNAPGDITHTMGIAPGEVVQIDDAVATIFGIDGFGAIRAVAPQPILLTARIYSRETGQEERETSGQAFAAVPAQRSIGTGEECHLIGLTNLVDGDFRYNVGFVETTGRPMSIEISLFASGGSGWITRTIQLRPFEQMQMSVDRLFNNIIGESDNFRLRATGASGEGRVIVFGSRVANGSQDATTFEMSFPPME